MEPLDYLRILRRRWMLLLGAPLLAFAVAYVLTASAPEAPIVPTGTTYEATHTLYAGYTEMATVAVPLETMAFLATKGEIPNRVAEAIGSDLEGPAVAAQVVVLADARLGTITFTTTQSNPVEAEALVDTYAAEVLAYFSEQAEARRLASIETTGALMEQQQQKVRELDAQLGVLDRERRDAGIEEESSAAALIRAERDAMVRQYSGTVERFQQLSAQGPSTAGLMTLEGGTALPVQSEGFQAPTSAGPRRLIATLMGLLLGLALVFVVDRVDTRVRTRRGAEEAFDLPVVTEVPRLSRGDRRRKALVTVKHPASVAAESYRVLRLGLQLMSRWILPAMGEHGGGEAGRMLERTEAKGPAKVVLVTSPGPAEGKSTTVANLAASFAEGGKVVMALDCDVRNPQLHNYLGVALGPGIAEHLADPEAHPLRDLARETAIPGVWLVTAGQGGGTAGLVRPDTTLLEDAAALADVVLIDVGPLLSVNEGATLAPKVDAVVLVARSGRTTADAARRSTELLARIEAPLLGVALVGMPRSELGSSYHYPYSGSVGTSGRDRRPLHS